jgi:aryl-phospho-beta-D-glucosidase BglC (GH1 family)
MKFCQIIGALSLGAFLLLGCEGENITEVATKETDRSLATRVGPVSQYGELLAGAVDGVGHIYGSCAGVAAGKEVQVRGMSMFWSVADVGADFYNETTIDNLVKDMKIEVIRLAIGTEEDWGIGGFMVDPDAQREMIKNSVMAAIKNDIYVIIDWHSHTATNQLEAATQFFDEMAQAYGAYNNVIFEVFNEPTNQGWPLIKEYAEVIVATIRKYSDNLILVGNPNWDQQPDIAIGKEVEDFKHNVAYTFHYYAMTHGNWEMGNANKAIKAGLPIFVSEWGTVEASGDGASGEAENQKWQEWMDANKLSSANWSVSNKAEGASLFVPGSTPESYELTASGEMVKGFLAKNPDSYTACKH